MPRKRAIISRRLANFWRRGGWIWLPLADLSGTGKSSLAAALAGSIGRAPGAVHLRSDIERKRLFNVHEFDRLPEAAYRPEITARTYQRLRDLAAIALDAGQSVIVDAVHLTPEERVAVEQVASQSKAHFTGLWLEAPVDQLIERVAKRKRDASDATAGIVSAQANSKPERWTGSAWMPRRRSKQSPGMSRGTLDASAGRRKQHRRAFEPAGPQISQGAVCLIERIGLSPRLDPCFRGKGEKFKSILPREIGDRDDLAFLPKQTIRKGRDIAHVNPGANDNATLAHRRERGRHQFTDRRIDDRRVERLGRSFAGAAGPGGTEAQGKSLRGRVAGAREGKNLAPLFARDLHDDMGRRAKAIKTESFCVARKAKRAPADETGTEQRRKRGGVAFFAQAEKHSARRRSRGSRNRRFACSP